MLSTAVIPAFHPENCKLNRDVHGLYSSRHSDDIRRSAMRPDSAFPVGIYLTNMQKIDRNGVCQLSWRQFVSSLASLSGVLMTSARVCRVNSSQLASRMLSPLCQTREWCMLPHPSRSLIKYVSAPTSRLAENKIPFASTNKHVKTPYSSSLPSIYHQQHTDKELKLQHKREVIYELDAALWVDALRSYLTLLQRAGLLSFKRREKPYKVWPLEIHTPTELQEKRRNETETLFIRSEFGGGVGLEI